MTIYTPSKTESRRRSANEANGLMTIYTPSEWRVGEGVLMRLMG